MILRDLGTSLFNELSSEGDVNVSDELEIAKVSVLDYNDLFKFTKTSPLHKKKPEELKRLLELSDDKLFDTLCDMPGDIITVEYGLTSRRDAIEALFYGGTTCETQLATFPTLGIFVSKDFFNQCKNLAILKIRKMFKKRIKSLRNWGRNGMAPIYNVEEYDKGIEDIDSVSEK